MTSRFSYYRPRGVPGCYIIEVVLDLADTETGEVWVARNREHNCGQCGKQQPTSVQEHAVNGTRQLAQYIIGNFIAGDTITVKIHDEACEPIFQETSHVATMQGFVHELIPFYLNDQVWNKVCLNPIDLIDKDCGEEAFDSVPRASGVPQSLRRVVPLDVEVILGVSPRELPSFLSSRIGYYDLVFVSRPNNLRSLLSALDEIPTRASNLPILYDAEAIFAIREALRHAVEGYSALLGRGLVD